MSIKAIFFDIDGTLVSFKSHEVPPSAVTAIREARERGVKTFIATGRSFPQIPDLSGLQFDGYITLNGVYCITGENEIVMKNAVPQEDIEAVIRYTEKEPFPCSFMTKDDIFINYVNRDVEELVTMVNLPLPKVIDLREVAGKEIFQVNVYVDEERERYLMRHVLVHCESTRWNPLFADINIRGYGKQSGIDSFVEHYRFRLDETMAFGDGGNDISMLKHVAVGVAMGNAMDEVKKTADYITASVDDDGIRHALKHFGVI
ncbi:MAG: Cof-type HAD-IIB family hydrolase [Bacteroidales bacterium]|jgi:Cof subfamily protein (haloacid dehalogenase superfamily)|nr:Cof-type HAD-IIB family hydrolase [Bacteroidales bacterium]